MNNSNKKYYGVLNYVKKILIDTSNSNETRVAVTLDGKLDDYEIETGEKKCC